MIRYLLSAALLGMASLASAGGHVAVSVNAGSCFVQPQVAVQAVAVPTVAVAPVAVAAAPVVTYAVPTVSVQAVQTFATPVFVQGHCGGGVNVQAFGGHSRGRIFGGRTSVRVRVR